MLTKFWQGHMGARVREQHSVPSWEKKKKYSPGSPWAVISLFALRDPADPACYHSGCDKFLCKLDDSRNILQRSRDSGLCGESDLVETGPGFGGHSTSRCGIFLQDPLTSVSTGTRMPGPSTGSKARPFARTSLSSEDFGAQ